MDYATWPTRTNRLDAEVTREEANRLAQEHAQIALELDPKRVAVERNRVIAPRSAHADTPLAEGDQIEIVHFVGGG